MTQQKSDTPKNDGLLVKNGVQVDILEKLRINQKPTSATNAVLNYQIHSSSTKKNDATYAQLKNQIDLIKNTCEA